MLQFSYLYPYSTLAILLSINATYVYHSLLQPSLILRCSYLSPYTTPPITCKKAVLPKERPLTLPTTFSPICFFCFSSLAPWACDLYPSQHPILLFHRPLESDLYCSSSPLPLFPCPLQCDLSAAPTSYASLARSKLISLPPATLPRPLQS